MASSREERLQMRQRGAGTRKVQEVDFGFAFGLPAAAAAASGAESTNSTGQVARQQQQQQRELRQPAETTTQTREQTQILSQDKNEATPTQSPRSRPRSARATNQTSRLSTGLVAEQEQGRSSKRRRISSKDGELEGSPVSPAQATATTQRGRATDGERAATESQPDDTRVTVQGIHTEARHDSPPTPTEEPEGSAKRKRGRPSKSSAPKAAQPARGEEIEKPPGTHERTRASRHSNIAQQTQSSERPNDHPIVKEPGTAEKDEARSGPGRRRSGPATQTTITADPSPEQSGSISRPKRQRQQPARAIDVEVADTEDDEEYVQPKRKRRKSAKSNAEIIAEPEPEPEPQEEQEVAQPAQTQRRTGKQKASANDAHRGPAKGNHVPPRDQAESQPEASQTGSQRRSGRASAGNGPITRRTRSSGADPGEQRREGTVSITVHHLVDTGALEATDASTDEQDSEDELDTRKIFPRRAGVNAADVLAQICREIVDKHLTGLATDVANESNQTKRKQAGRQRKAIEAYGSQLQGRLFELSELLESNFALGVKLRRAKREAAEMRNRLLEVRRQRHEVALRMDAVRQKHSAEENAKMSRNAINNSLHKLESTLERSQARPADDDDDNDNGLAGLEFKLRTVAEDVSSRAEGSQGGLLGQVRAFNAQLERTARALAL